MALGLGVKCDRGDPGFRLGAAGGAWLKRRAHRRTAATARSRPRLRARPSGARLRDAALPCRSWPAIERGGGLASRLYRLPGRYGAPRQAQIAARRRAAAALRDRSGDHQLPRLGAAADLNRAVFVRHVAPYDQPTASTSCCRGDRRRRLSSTH